MSGFGGSRWKLKNILAASEEIAQIPPVPEAAAAQAELPTTGEAPEVERLRVVVRVAPGILRDKDVMSLSLVVGMVLLEAEAILIVRVAAAGFFATGPDFFGCGIVVELEELEDDRPPSAMAGWHVGLGDVGVDRARPIPALQSLGGLNDLVSGAAAADYDGNGFDDSNTGTDWYWRF